MNINHALSVRSDFSIGESMFQVDKIVARAKELGYESVALVDTMNVSNMVTFTQKAKKAGIKPIIGCTLRVYQDPTYRKPSKASGEKEKDNPFCTLKVYAKNEAGVRSILKLLSKGNSPEYFYYHARVGFADVLELNDVVVTTGDLNSFFHNADAENLLAQLKEKLDVFVEIVPINTPLFQTLNTRAIGAASLLGLPLIVGYPVLYQDPDDADTLDVLRAISMNAKMSDGWLPRQFIKDFYLKPPVELARALVPACPDASLNPEWGRLAREALAGLDKLASLCSYEFKKLPPCLPKMAEDEFAALRALATEGFKDRLLKSVMGYQPAKEDLPAYVARLKYELDTIGKMGFSGYFLLVRDIVVWAKTNGIIVGPGRGSVGGSLLAYLLGITDVDPLRFDLLFERFINPERIDLPDADLDFMSTRRHEVIEYIVGKYGRECVAGISNFNTLASASALRDVARVHEMPEDQYSCSKLVPKEHGIPVDLTKAAEQVPEIEKFKVNFPAIWKHATKLEGVMKSLGQHAAGVVVAAEPLINRAVVETRSGGAVVNWDKSVVEEWGLIKMDVLGLSTLDMLDLARRYVKERHGKTIDFLKLPLEEPDVMDAFGRSDTVGVFQFESSGMRNLLKQLALGGRLTFNDLVAVVALFRPGPLDAGLCDDYIAIKQGAKRPYYEHKNMEPALRKTFGVIVYQEQVMQICRDVAGFTLPESDHVRKAMGKKDLEKMKEWRERFVKGAATHSGMEDTLANALWDKIEVFAGYAFNLSHSVEYSLVSYWTMWMKVRYPAEFYAAAMTIVDDDDKLAGLVIDARTKEIQVLPPDIKLSSKRIEISGEKVLLAPFQAVKGISENVASYIMEFREKLGRPIEREEDLSAENIKAVLGHAKFNKAHRDKLERIGAFVSVKGGFPALHPDRLKDRLELMPGFTVDAVKASRDIPTERLALIKVVRLMEEAKACDKCSLKGGVHPMPVMGKQPKFMMVFDCPNWKEEEKGKLMVGDSADFVRAALKEVGLSADNGYFTTLVKSPKPAKAKGLTNEQINGCVGYLQKEIETLRPPVIVAMGGAAMRHFAPGIKGNPAELAGKVIWRPDLEASIVFGINPAAIMFDASKIKQLQAVAQQIADLVK